MDQGRDLLRRVQSMGTLRRPRHPASVRPWPFLRARASPTCCRVGKSPMTTERGPVSYGTSALMILLAALGRLLWRGLRFAPSRCPKPSLALIPGAGA